MARVKFASDVTTAMIKAGTPPEYAMPILQAITAQIAHTAPQLRSGPDFGDVANALVAATQSGNAQVMGAVNQAAQVLSQPATVPQFNPQMGQNGPPGAPAGPGGPPPASPAPGAPPGPQPGGPPMPSPDGSD